ncbi:MAG: hypothetical protein RSA27_08165 [Oscillospiraceae bacterium]
MCYGVLANLDTTIAVGFGTAVVTKDEEIIYDERDYDEFDEMWTIRKAEEAAAKDPDHDWRVVIDAPMYGVTYQRHDTEKWVLVSKNNGFV